MKFQGRFSHLKAEHIAKMQAFVDEKIQKKDQHRRDREEYSSKT
jgi:hypothetical protein